MSYIVSTNNFLSCFSWTFIYLPSASLSFSVLVFLCRGGKELLSNELNLLYLVTCLAQYALILIF